MTSEKNQLAKREGHISIWANFLLFIIKYTAGILTGSLALITDAWHTISDSLSSLILIISVKFAEKPADEKHPFGHGRSEIIGTSLIGMLLVVIAFNFFKDAVLALIEHRQVFYGKLAIIVTTLSIIIKELLARYSFWCFKKTGLASLKADAWHHRSDALSSLIILIGIFFAKSFWWMDSILGLIVSLMIFYSAVIIIKESFSTLLGETAPPEISAQVEKITRKFYSRDIKLHHLHLHNYGEHREMTFHIMLDGNTPLKEAHALATKIENQIKTDLGITTTIHLEAL